VLREVEKEGWCESELLTHSVRAAIIRRTVDRSCRKKDRVKASAQARKTADSFQETADGVGWEELRGSDTKGIDDEDGADIGGDSAR